MISKENKDLAKWAMNFALTNGCEAAYVVINSGTKSNYDVRDKKIETLLCASENSISIKLFTNGRYGSFSSNRLSKNDLEKFIKNGIETTQFLTEDKARCLPDSARLFKGNAPDLQKYDQNYITVKPDEKIALATAAVEEILGKDERIISVTASYNDHESFSYAISSNGFEGDKKSTNYSLYCSVSIKGDGDARPQDGWSDGALHWADLPKAGYGLKALQHTMRKLGQEKAESGKYTMVIDNKAGSRLLDPLISAMSGSSLHQKNSFLLNKSGEKLFSDQLTIVDDPHMVRAFGASYFDYEGVATEKRTIIDKGVLKSYFIDTYSAKKLKTKPTISGPSVLTFDMGDKNVDQMIASVDKGIYVTGFNGGNSNSSTGDFSAGIEGFLIESGKLTKAISEMNITGNLITLWNNLVEVGNDPILNRSWRTPSLKFENIDFNGK